METKELSATELRIGNLILFSPSGKAAVNARAVTVKSISDKSVIVNDNGLDLELFYGSASTKPIPLTEEWHHRFPDIYTWDTYEEVILISVSTGDYEIKKELLQFVHQWQNLFFALTGTDLPISQTTPTK